MTEIYLQGNQLTALPAEVFDGLSSLTEIHLQNNQLTALPNGVFDGLTSLKVVQLGQQTTDLSLTVSLEKVADGQFKAIAPAGAPFDIALPLTVTNGSISGGASSITIPVGNIESDTLTVTRTADTTAAVTVNIGTLPGGLLGPGGPSGHSGYALVKSTTGLPLTVISAVANNAPVFTDGTSITRSIAENTATNTNIGTAIAATDEDTGDTLTYTLSGTDAASFSIVSTTGQLQTKAALDYETKTSYTVTITVSDGNGGSDSITVTINVTDVAESTITPVSQRTPQVRDAIVAAVPGVNSAADVTEAHLAAITVLNLLEKGITSLKAGDFDGLSGLTWLRLNGNPLTSLPAGVFSELSSLTTLSLHDTYKLTSLPADVFSGLSSLTRLYLNNNKLASLPKGAFSGLTALELLWLSSNSLTDLPADVFSGLTSLTTLYLTHNDLTGLPEDVFSGLTSLTELWVYNNKLTSLPKGAFSGLTSLESLKVSFNRLTSLPDDIFEGLTSLTTLSLRGNAVDPFPITVSLEKAADGQFKAVAPAGAPFDMVLPLTVTNGSISGGASSITISTGSVESGTLTVTRTGGTTADVRVNIGTLPSLPQNHSGYSFVKSTDLPLVYADLADDGFTPVSDRTPAVRDAIVAALQGVNSAADVTEADLAAITRLNLINKSITSLKAGDFEGLSGLTSLFLHTNRLTSLPADVFDGLSALTQLDLDSNQLATLPAGVFDGLSSVVVLGLSNNQLTTLPVGVFDELSALTNLVLHNNQLTTLSAGVFDGLSALTQLQLNNNQLTTLPTDVFDELSALTDLFLQNNQLTSLSAGAFNGLSALKQLLLNNNQLTTLPADVFDGLTALTELWLNANQLTSLPTDVFDALSALTQLYLDDNQLTTLASDVFDGVSGLTSLLLNNNQLTSLPADVFDGLSALSILHLHNNQLSTVSAGVFEGLAVLKQLLLSGNSVNPILLGVSLEKVADGQFKAVAPAGAPFEMVLPLTVTNGSINGGATSVTISAGKLESGTLIVTRTAGTTTAVTVNVGTLPGIPTSHQGYALLKSAGLPLEVITDTNTVPVFTDGTTATRTVAENTASGVNIGTPVSATDTDGDTLTYTLSGTDAASFSIVSTTGQLQTKAALDYETKTTYSVTVSVSDGNGGSDSITVTVNITDVNENRAPVFVDGATATRTIAENTAANTNIGTAVAATDADTGDTLTYTLGGTDAASFGIVSTTGQLQTKAALDYETKTSYTVTVSVSDGNGGSDSITVTITVTDVNENRAPVFVDGATATRTIAENTAANTNIGTAVAATDADTGDTLTYTLGGTDAAAFSIVSTTGQLETKAALDYETKSAYSVTITVSDGILTDTITVTITVTDIDEVPAEVGEITVVPGTCQVGDVLAPGESCTYPGTDTEFSVNNSGIGQFLFFTAGNNLNIKDTNINGVSYTLVAKKLASGSWEIEQVGTSTAAQTVNTAPTFTDGTSTARTIAENTAANTNIGTAIAATDADSGDTLTYTLSGTDAASFSIVSTSGQLQTRAALDYETKTSYSVTITVSDGNGGSDSITVTINVTDVNETPANNAPVFTDGTTATRPVAENTASGQHIGAAVAATDADNDTLTYTLSGTDASSFGIDRTTGQLKTKAALDYETKNSYSVTVSVSDGNGGSDSITVTITVTDVNENRAPVFADGASTTRTIAENTAANTNIGTAITATDADNDTLTYTLSGTDAGAFRIVSTTGQLQTRAALDYETKASYSVTVSVSDGSLTDTISVTINITDIADTPVVSGVTPVSERTPQVRDAIVAAVPGVNSAANVTEAHLARITSLNLRKKGISALKVGDFDGLSSLREIELAENQLRTLPTEIFSGLSALRILYLNKNELTVLPEKLFEGLTALEHLYMNTNQLVRLPEKLFNGLVSLRQINVHTNQLTSLPPKVFSGLPALLEIFLRNNQLTEIPADVFSGLPLINLNLDRNRLTDLPADVFSGQSSLTSLLLNNNQLSTLPTGVFSGLTALTRLWLHSNTVDPLPLIVSLEKVGVNQFKAVVSAGAPFRITLPINVANGSIRSGATTLTIPQGRVESGTLSVTRTVGTTAAVTVDIGTLPGLPANHQGYKPTKAANLPRIIINTPANTAPVFAEGRNTTRTIAENTPTGIHIGPPVTATDADNDTLTYSLGGTDAATFGIDATTGQLKTKAPLDYETKTTYTVTVTVSDGSLTDTITVTINITDINELPTTTAICKVGDVLAPGESCTYPGTDAVFSVLDNGSSQWNIPDFPLLSKVSTGGSINFTADINNENYHFVAKEVSNNAWEIEAIGGDTKQQPDTSEQPGDTGGTPTLSVSTAAPLTEATLHGGVITLNLSSGIFESSSFRIREAVSVLGINGVTVDTFSVDRVSDTQATVELEYDGNMTANGTLTVSLEAGAIQGYNGAVLTTQLSIPAVSESVTASTAAPLTEATLDESIVTLTLTGRKFEGRNSTIRGAVSVSGISGVTVRSFDIDRQSDTEVTVELTFNGNLNADGTLTFTVGPDAIAGYNGPALTAQVTVSASGDTPVVETPVVETPIETAPPVESDYNHIEGPWLWMIAPGGDIDIDNLSEASEGVITEPQIAQNGVNEGDHFNDLQWTSGRLLPTTVCGILLCSSDNVINVVREIGLTDGEQLNSYSAYALINIFSPRPQNDVLMGVGSDDSIKVWLNGSAVYKNDVSRRTTGIQNQFPVHLNAGNNLLLIKVCNHAGLGFNNDWGMFFKLYLDTQDYTVSLPTGGTGGQQPQTPQQPQQPVNTGGTPTLSVSTAAPLTEATLHGGVITLNLSGGIFESSSSKVRTAVTVSGINGVTVSTFDVDRVSDTQATVEPEYDGNMTANGTLTISVWARAIKDYNGAVLTAQLSIPAVTESVTASTAATLTEATLDESVVTLTLTGRKFEGRNSAIRGAVSVSGISGVTVRSFDIDRQSDTEVTVELTYDGDMTTDGTLTLTVGADAIASYNGPALTDQVSVSAGDTPADTGGQNPDPAETPQQPGNRDTPEQPADTGGTPTLSVSTAAPLTEATLHGGVITLNLSGGIFERSMFWIRNAISVSGITGVDVEPFGGERISDTQATIELEYEGNMTVNGILTITLEADGIKDYEGATLTAQISVTASTESVVASVVSPLTEATLDGSVVTLTLSGAKFSSSIWDIRGNVKVSGIAGVTIPWNQPKRKSDTELTVKLEFDGDMTTDGTLTFTVDADTIAGYNGPALTDQVSVSAGDAPADAGEQNPDPAETPQQPGNRDTPEQPADTGGTPTLSVSTAAPLTEATLHEGIVTLTLSDGTYESFFDIADAVSVSGITGVTFDDFFGIKRVSNTKVTVELEFNGNMNTNGTLTFTVGSDGIKDYDGATLTAQIQVTANTESVAASTTAPLTEATLDGSTVTLTLSGAKFSSSIWDIRGNVKVSGITGVTIPWNQPKRKSDTEITIELEFDGDMTTDGTLTFTVDADTIAGYNGPALTAHVPVTADRENALLANFPNPFNPETWIPYQLEKPTEVTITIYAIDGRLVRTLALGHQPAGIYRSRSRAAYWDGKNAFGEPVASGVYFYTLTAGDFAATRKMLIRK